MYLMFNEQPAELTINIYAVKLFQTTLTLKATEHPALTQSSIMLDRHKYIMLGEALQYFSSNTLWEEPVLEVLFDLHNCII